MLGSGLENVTHLADNEISTLYKEDTVIIWGHSNDINKNETNIGLQHLRYFVANRNNTKNVVITALHRCDLHETSCINKEMQVFSKKLHKMGKLVENMAIININLNSGEFMQHVLHLSTSFC
jgi:hypothetical protein